ncbi:hypothetical protein ABT354_20605 [Streptomyces sp. NPDC000594]|uniref:hypothetical protein n=1 Tax=Streptomyces sp. NPDC000594 TaxID=3154261 RepID=UPI00331A0DEB
MLTYHDVMTADFGGLSAAADKWQDTANELAKVEKRYRDSVEKITMDRAWLGESANAARANFAATRYEYEAAQTQAKATAVLLRNAHAQFTELKKQLESSRADAVKAGMKVSEQGHVSYDYDRLSAQERGTALNHPGHAKEIQTAVQSWQDHLRDRVTFVDDADKDLKRDLEAVVKDAGGDKRDATAGGFNGDAGKIAASDDQAKKVRTELASVVEMKDNETLDDYLKRLQREGITRLTGSEQLGKTITAYLAGTGKAVMVAQALYASGMWSHKLHKYLKTGVPMSAPGTLAARVVNPRLASAQPGSLLSRVPPNLARAMYGSDLAAEFGAYWRTRTNEYVIPKAHQANLVTAAKNGGLGQAAKAAGWMRGMTVVGSAGATIYGVANLATYNTDMIKANPDKFATDLTGTAFNASMTALAVAPNPVTAGLAIGTGVAYLGATAWENREAIMNAGREAAEWTGKTAEKIGDGVSKGLDKVGDGIASGAKKIFNNPFD